MLNLGDSIFYLQKNFGVFTRKKIYKIDDEGVEWFRYDKPIFSYSIIESKVIGIVQHSISGTLVSWEDDLQDGQIIYHTDKDETIIEFGEDYFSSKEEAERAGDEWSHSHDCRD